jgi:hypothetical protein
LIVEIWQVVREEVKAAAGGLPEILTSTLSALANLPGGGTIILGLEPGPLHGSR